MTGCFVFVAGATRMRGAKLNPTKCKHTAMNGHSGSEKKYVMPCAGDCPKITWFGFDETKKAYSLVTRTFVSYRVDTVILSIVDLADPMYVVVPEHDSASGFDRTCLVAE
jgi:hypothetical protein